MHLLKKSVANFLKLYVEAVQHNSQVCYYYKISSIEQSNSVVYVGLQARGKRTAKKVQLSSLFATQYIIEEIHPFESYIIGILGYSQSKHALNLAEYYYKQFLSIKHGSTSQKIQPFLKVKEDMGTNKIYIVMQGESQCKAIEPNLLIKHPEILCGLGSEQSCYIGYKFASLSL